MLNGIVRKGVCRLDPQRLPDIVISSTLKSRIAQSRQSCFLVSASREEELRCSFETIVEVISKPPKEALIP